MVLDPFVDEVQIDVNVLREGFGAEPADRRNTWVRWGCDVFRLCLWMPEAWGAYLKRQWGHHPLWTRSPLKHHQCLRPLFGI